MEQSLLDVYLFGYNCGDMNSHIVVHMRLTDEGRYCELYIFSICKALYINYVFSVYNISLNISEKNPDDLP